MQFARIPGSWSIGSLARMQVRLPQQVVPPDVTPPPPIGEPVSRKKGDHPEEMNLIFDAALSRQCRVNTSRIAFAQCCQIVADGQVVRPGRFAAKWKFREPFTLDNGVFLDVLDDFTDPYFPACIIGNRIERNGLVSAELARMGDAPQIGRTERILFDPVHHPNGFRKVTLKLQAFAVAKDLPDADRWFEGALWEWSTDWQEFQRGERGKATVTVMNVGFVTLDLRAAFDRFCAVTGVRP
jgi:hypothetical protein